MSQANSPTCFQCGSLLILISEKTEKLEQSKFSQTNTVYRCSNDECQEEKDKQTEKRIKLKEEKVIAEQKRAEERLERRQNLLKQKQLA